MLTLALNQVGAARFAFGRVIADLQTVERLHRAFEAQQETARITAATRFREALAAADAGREGDFSMDEFTDLKRFPNIVVEALFVAQHARVEVLLTSLCQFLYEKARLPTAPRVLRGRGLVRARDYLILAGLELSSSDHWPQILALIQLRNIIVHRRGVAKADDATVAQAVSRLVHVVLGPTGRLIFKPNFITQTTNVYCGFLSECEGRLLEAVVEPLVAGEQEGG